MFFRYTGIRTSFIVRVLGDYRRSKTRGQLFTRVHNVALPIVAMGVGNPIVRKNLPLFEVALVLVRFDHVASIIVNANHGNRRRKAVAFCESENVTIA